MNEGGTDGAAAVQLLSGAHSARVHDPHPASSPPRCLQGGIVLQFFWAPFPSNLTALLESGRLEGGAAAAAASRGAAEGDADEQQEAAEQLEGDQQEGEQQDGEQREQQQEQQREDEEQAQDVDALKPVEEDSSTQGEEGDEEEEEEGARRRLRRAAARRGGKRRRLAEGALDAAAAGATAPKAASQQPALVLLSSMLWHLLHVTDPADFQARLAALRDAAAGYAARQQQERRGKRGSAGGPRMVVTSGTEMFPNRMKTAQKQSNMTPANLDAYNKAVVEVRGGRRGCEEARRDSQEEAACWTHARSHACLRCLAPSSHRHASPLVWPRRAAGGHAGGEQPPLCAGPVSVDARVRRGVQPRWRALCSW